MPCNALLTPALSEILYLKMLGSGYVLLGHHLHTSCCCWSSCRAFWATARAAENITMMTIDGVDPIIQTLWLWWGVVNCIWQNRKGLAEIDVICKVTILLAGYLTEEMLLTVWGERLKCLVRRRRLIAPCAAMVFVCKSNCDRGTMHTSTSLIVQ